MVSLGDFNYAYLAGRLLDGENGEDMYSVVCDIRSLGSVRHPLAGGLSRHYACRRHDTRYS